MSFKLVSFFTFIFAVLLPRVGECRRFSNVFVGCVTVNNLFHRPVTYKLTYNIVDLDFISRVIAYFVSNFVAVVEL